MSSCDTQPSDSTVLLINLKWALRFSRILIDLGEWWPVVVQVRGDESPNEGISNRNEKKGEELEKQSLVDTWIWDLSGGW